MLTPRCHINVTRLLVARPFILTPSWYAVSSGYEAQCNQTQSYEMNMKVKCWLKSFSTSTQNFHLFLYSLPDIMQQSGELVSIQEYNQGNVMSIVFDSQPVDTGFDPQCQRLLVHP